MESKFNSMEYIIKMTQVAYEVEEDIEAMVRDNVLDIFVDENGIFYYQITDSSFQQMLKMDKAFQRTMKTFEQMCVTRGVDPLFMQYYKMLRKR